MLGRAGPQTKNPWGSDFGNPLEARMNTTLVGQLATATLQLNKSTATSLVVTATPKSMGSANMDSNKDKPCFD